MFTRGLKLRQSDLLYGSKAPVEISGMDILKPAEFHSPWDICSLSKMATRRPMCLLIIVAVELCELSYVVNIRT